MGLFVGGAIVPADEGLVADGGAAGALPEVGNDAITGAVLVSEGCSCGVNAVSGGGVGAGGGSGVGSGAGGVGSGGGGSEGAGWGGVG